MVCRKLSIRRILQVSFSTATTSAKLFRADVPSPTISACDPCGLVRAGETLPFLSPKRSTIFPSMNTLVVLEQGRDAFRRQAWEAAFAQLSAAQRGLPLEPADIERLAIVTQLLGRDTDSNAFWSRAHQSFLQRRGAGTRCAIRILAGPDAPDAW